MVPNANNSIQFRLEGEGEIVATDNGNPADLVSFASLKRNAYNGMALAIVRANKGSKGSLKLIITSKGLENTAVKIDCKTL